MPLTFTSRRIIWADGQPSHDPEDFSVLDGDRAVGRIYHTTGGFRGDGFGWFVYGSSRKGFAQTRDQAAAEWKVAYQRFLEDRR
jgi:hypothetical protein